MALLFLSGGLLLAGVLAFVASVAMATGGRQLPSGPHAFDAVVSDGPTEPSPVGPPIAYGYVEISTRVRDGSTYRRHALHRELRGYKQIAFTTGDGTRTLTFTDALAQLKDFPAEEQVLDSLAGHPEEANVPGWRSEPADSYYVEVIGLRRGETVLVVTGDDGSLREVWKGGRAHQESRQAEIGAFNRKAALAMGVLGVLSLLGALVSGLLALFR